MAQKSIAASARYVGNLGPMPGVFPDYKAPIVRSGTDGRELTARWGMPSSAHAIVEATKKRAAKLEAKGAGTQRVTNCLSVGASVP
jgi:hypothetical protein